MTPFEITWHIFMTVRKIQIDTEETLTDCRWPLWLRCLSLSCHLKCSCKADHGPVFRERAAPSALLVPQFSFTSLWCIYRKRNGILWRFVSGIYFENTHQVWCFCLWVRTQAFISCLSAMSLIMTLCVQSSVRLEEAFVGWICGCLSGLRCNQFFTNCLAVGWVLHCLNGPALHCHSPNHHTGPGLEEKHESSELGTEYWRQKQILSFICMPLYITLYHVFSLPHNYGHYWRAGSWLVEE